MFLNGSGPCVLVWYPSARYRLRGRRGIDNCRRKPKQIVQEWIPSILLTSRNNCITWRFSQIGSNNQFYQYTSHNIGNLFSARRMWPRALHHLFLDLVLFVERKWNKDAYGNFTCQAENQPRQKKKKNLNLCSDWSVIVPRGLVWLHRTTHILSLYSRLGQG